MATNNENNSNNNHRQLLLAGAADDGEEPVDVDALIRHGETQMAEMAEVRATLGRHGEKLQDHEERIQARERRNDETERDVDVLKTAVFGSPGFGLNLGQAQAQEDVVQRSTFARIFFGAHRVIWSVISLPFRILRAILGFFVGILRSALVNLLTLVFAAGIAAFLALVAAYYLARGE